MALGFFVLAAVSPAVRGADPPDILFIAIDDLNDWVGVLGGHPQARTPRIDALAERGMLFTNAHASAPLCNPSRTALLTGLRPSSSGVYENDADWRQLAVFRNISTLPRFFRDQGYETIGAGKIFHAHTFDPEGFSGYNDQNAWSRFFPSVDRQLPDEVVPPDRPVNGNPFTKDLDWHALTEAADRMGDTRVAAWISGQIAHTNGRPRFVAAGIYRPHLPWYTPSEYFDAHPLETIELPDTLAGDLDDVPEIATMPYLEITDRPPMALHRWIVSQDKCRQGVPAYPARVSNAEPRGAPTLDQLVAG
ncbi:MAG: sulfatase-like hydrolase/transferase, partial [Gammaproteobacteria bacterium]|nr:sulfatase-like hydrolase/transferase [Gammaproteobacteria bacterium]